VLQVSGGVPGRAGGRPALYGGEESVSSVQRRLQELAAWMQQQQRREIRLDEARTLLRPTYQELMGWHAEQADDYVGRLLESLALESGLVQQRDRGYSFAHYTLQEYLTARAYDQRGDGVAGLFAQRDQPRWRETILLAVGHWATSGDPERARQLLRRLLDTGEAAALLLAGAALDDADADRVPELTPLRTETSARLRTLAFDPAHCPDPHTRNQAGELLDRLEADNRPALDPTHPDYWAQRIEPGPFVMGEGQKRFTYRINQPYALARFPVTNQQYLRFLEDLERQGRTEAARRHRPRGWPGRRYPAGEGHHPVVTVSWVDATAFAQWANATFLTDEQRARGEEIRLPTEPEWERAAAYPVNLSVNAPEAGRRTYPWGEADADFPANIDENGIGGTSVVGIFPQGAAACGAEDLAGNVWEWCSTPYQDYPLPEDLQPDMVDPDGKYRGKEYVLRGGSWFDDQSYARCAYRTLFPDFDVADYGFRLAHCSPLDMSSCLHVFMSLCFYVFMFLCLHGEIIVVRSGRSAGAKLGVQGGAASPCPRRRRAIAGWWIAGASGPRRAWTTNGAKWRENRETELARTTQPAGAVGCVLRTRLVGQPATVHE
jgi:formylglycine-generating enzyme required for sulfatase activity